MNDLRLPPDALTDLMKRHVGAEATPQARMMAAQGLVPAPPAEQVMMLHQLMQDEEADIRDSAMLSLMEIPSDILRSALRGITHGVPLHSVAQCREETEILQEIVLHPAASDALLERLARTADTDIADLIAGNEVRVLKHPPIIEALYLNENARMSTINRLIELARRNRIELRSIPALRSLVVDVEEAPLDEGSADEDFAAHLRSSIEEEMEERARRMASDEEETEPEEAEEESRSQGNRQAQIDRMSLSEKVRLATLGNQTDREFLIRSPNRLVHMAAVTSPKVQFKDVNAWSSNKSLPEGVITYLANHREYKRNYQIQTQLINNPKLPLQYGIRLLAYLHERDLKALMKNRNISPQLRRSTKQLLDQRGKRKK